MPADIDESDVPAGLDPAELAMFLAESKARKIAAVHPDAFVLGADTVVSADGRLFGKADSDSDARAMLLQLAGTRQSVITGVSVMHAGKRYRQSASEASVVAMRPMTDAELDAYVSGGDWRGKAGAYGIQDHDPAKDPFVRLVDGEMDNVVGLPMGRVRRMLADAGVTPQVA